MSLTVTHLGIWKNIARVKLNGHTYKLVFVKVWFPSQKQQHCLGPC